MPEIMSAEKFADYIDSHCLYICHGEVEGVDIAKTSESIRSRDAAILEKCKDAILNKYCAINNINPFFNDAMCDATLAAYVHILDSVLAEIEEE